MPPRSTRLPLWHLLPAGLAGLLALAPLASLPSPTVEQAMTAGADAMQRGQFDQATQHWQTASTTAAQTGDTVRQVDALLQLTDAYLALGQSRNALATLRAAQPLAEQLDDPARRAAVAGALGKTLWLTGTIDEARRHLDNSISLARQANASQIAAASFNHLGNLAAEQGDPHAARIAYENSLNLAQQAQDPSLVTIVQINTARLAAREQDRRTAEALLAKATRLVKTLPDSHDKAFHLLAIGQLRRTLPGASAMQRAQALQNFTAAAVIARQLNDQRSGLTHKV